MAEDGKSPLSEEPVAVYGRRLAAAEDQVGQLEKRSKALSWLRLGLFLALAGSFVGQFWGKGRLGLGGWFLSGFLLLAFALLARHHGRVLKALAWQKELAQVQREALARWHRRWRDLPLLDLPIPEAAAAVARDLGFSGRASVGHWLGSVATPLGRSTLGRWLSAGASVPDVERRQAAVRELAPSLELRQRFEVTARRLGGAATGPEPFLRWAEGEPPAGPSAGWLLLARGLTAATILLAAATAAGWVLWHFLAFLALVNLAVSYGQAKSIHGIFGRASSREGAFQAYGALFRLLSEERFEAPILAELQEELSASGLQAHDEMERLHGILVLSDLRLFMLHAVIQALTLWDFHVFGRLEAWRRRVGPHARAWLEGLAEWEVLAAFGGIAFDQEDWALPRLEAGATAVTARGLAHPLIPPGRVANDVQLGPPGSFLLVTGSNMSGKSTLLRALGVNLALGQAGAPVAATSLVFPPLTLATSILVEDSLADGASFFWAELQRLKTVVDQAQGGAEQGRPVLYLLDEILRGTNSAERRIAVEKVLGHLLSQGALGAVSTHDLELARLPSLTKAARPVFFRETLHPGQDPFMTFDFRLQEGIAPTTNALELLALVGLDPDRRLDQDRRPAVGPPR